MNTPRPVGSAGPERPSLFDRLFVGLLRDRRDLVFPRLAAAITLTVIPAAAILFLLPSWLVWILAAPYVVTLFVLGAARFGLMLHAVGHRPIFKREYRALGHYVPWVLGPFFGHTPASFDAHHMWMHHAENNMLGDVSTTLPYVRDEFSDFLHYWARFFFFGYVHLPRYLWLRGRRKILVRFAIGEMFWYALAGLALWVNFSAGMVVFVIPMLLMRWLLMCGNFAQHAFVDVDDPDNPYKNSNNLTNARYNRKAFNDGYHIVHHLRPGMHWSEMPAAYEANVGKYAENEAIVFDGINDNQQLWYLLMTKNYDTLASRLVDFRGRNHSEKVAFLKSRARRTLGERPSLWRLETPADVERTRRKAG